MHPNRRSSHSKRLAGGGGALALLFLLTACTCDVDLHTVKGSGIEKTLTRQTTAFSRVDLKGSMRVTIVVCQPRSVTIRGDDNLIGNVRTRVGGETLAISNRHPYRSKIGLSVAISVPTLTAVELSGSGAIDVKDVQGASFAADLSGSGDITVNGTAARIDLSISGSGEAKLDGLAAHEVRAEISGSGDIEASGTTDRLDVSVPGSGDVRFDRLVARDAHVDISGSGNVQVWASDSLVAEISGSGDIKYAGNPRQVSKDVSGSGEIKAL
ncbi:MAG: head GIN domain-containing protein [Gaiellaceae bacterium]